MCHTVNLIKKGNPCILTTGTPLPKNISTFVICAEGKVTVLSLKTKILETLWNAKQYTKSLPKFSTPHWFWILLEDAKNVQNFTTNTKAKERIICPIF